jgi:hypothetical protein
MSSKIYYRYRDGEWSALYVDGNLAVVGDHYRTDDFLAEELGVNEVYSADFLTPDQRGALPTLEQVRAVTQIREAQAEEANKLREQAAMLIAQAEILENHA